MRSKYWAQSVSVLSFVIHAVVFLAAPAFAHSEDHEVFEASQRELDTTPCQHGLRSLRITRALQSADLPRAAIEMRRGLECFPNDPGMQTLRARLLYAQDQKALARLVIDEVIRLSPNSVGALKLSAHWYFAENDFARASSAAARVLDFAHAPDDVIFAVNVAKAQGNVDAGFALLERAMRKQDLDVYRVNAFDWAMTLGNAKRALHYVPGELPNNALGANWWMRRGDAHLLNNQRDKARANYLEARKLLQALRPHVKKRAAIAKLIRNLELKQDSL